MTMDSNVFSSLTTLSLSLSYLNSTCNLIQSRVHVLYILHVTNMYFRYWSVKIHHYRRRNDVLFILSSNFVHVWITFNPLIENLVAGQRECAQCLYYWQGPVLYLMYFIFTNFIFNKWNIHVQHHYLVVLSYNSFVNNEIYQIK